MENTIVNFYDKIWVFWNEEWKGEIIPETDQQLTIEFTH